MIIKGLEFDCTGGMCPEQYDVYDADGRQVGYVRLRWGCLRCFYPECLGEVIYETGIGGEYTGRFDNDEQRMEHLCKIAEKILDKISESSSVDYIETPKEYDFSTEFPTWIIAFCPDMDSWFVTNNRFFFYEYDKEFETEEEGIEFFKSNPQIFYEEEIRMGAYKPSFYQGGVWLDNTRELIKI